MTASLINHLSFPTIDLQISDQRKQKIKDKNYLVNEIKIKISEKAKFERVSKFLQSINDTSNTLWLAYCEISAKRALQYPFQL